jgi:hypothetical protein
MIPKLKIVASYILAAALALILAGEYLSQS